MWDCLADTIEKRTEVVNLKTKKLCSKLKYDTSCQLIVRWQKHLSYKDEVFKACASVFESANYNYVL